MAPVNPLGSTTFDIPQVRGSGLYKEALDKGLHSERATTLALV